MRAFITSHANHPKRLPTLSQHSLVSSTHCTCWMCVGNDTGCRRVTSDGKGVVAVCTTVKALALDVVPQQVRQITTSKHCQVLGHTHPPCAHTHPHPHTHCVHTHTPPYTRTHAHMYTHTPQPPTLPHIKDTLLPVQS